MKLYLTRHAISTKSKSGYGIHIRSAPILSEGKIITEKMALFLKDIPTDKNVSSEFLRCRQTAKIISNITHKQFSYDNRLNEYLDETFTEFEMRVTNFMEYLRQLPNETILICTHAAVISVISNILNKKATTETDLQTNYPGTGILLEYYDGNITEFNFNQ